MTSHHRRRTTLAVLSQSMANTRITPARTSLGVSKTPRSSMRSSMGGRRSSVFGKSNSKIQEPRPIGDKSYLQDNVRSLIHFLTSHQYDREVSLKLLLTPARKDFVLILTFLMRHIDPNFEFSQIWADDVPVFFEAIGYPFRISKRSLLSVGSPHTWPSLLAALVWLADLITYLEKVDEADKKGGLESDNGEKVFYGYLANAYTKFLGGSDNFSFLENDLTDQFKEKNQVAQDEIERFRESNEKLRINVNEMQQSNNEISELGEKRRDLNNDILKFEKLVNDLELYKDKLVTQREQKQSEFDALQNDITSLSKEKQLIHTQMQAQEMSAVDVARMTQERKMLESSEAKLCDEMEELKKKEWDLDMSLTKSMESVEKKIQLYNQKATSLSLIPHTAKYAHGVQYALHFDKDAETIDEMLSVDLKRIVKPSLLKLKECFTKTFYAQQSDKRSLHCQVSRSGELKAEKMMQLAALHARFERVEKTYAEQYETMNNELMSKMDQVEELEVERQRWQCQNNGILVDSNNKCAHIQQQLEQATLHCMSEQDMLRNEMTSTMEALAQHKVNVVNRLEMLDEHVEQIKLNVT